jgi:FKBP-type peptidyl-prolyl cis-trans isomerase SlpA
MNNEIVTPNEQTRITQGSHVVLHFAVSLENGTAIDSTFERPEPVSLTIGDGSLLEGFESVLMNLQAGDTRTAHLAPEQAFGQWNPYNVQTFTPAQFALTGAEPEVGMLMEFADKGNSTLVGVLSAVNDDEIKVDFNHPLAGQNVIFKVEIIKVTPKDSQAVKFS